jgi:dihydroflavonol-4-reductase
MSDRRVLITGISGFIARQCALEMLGAGYLVRGTTRSRATHDSVRGSIGEHRDVARLELVEADLTADEGWREAVAGCSAVLHVASPFPSKQPKDENVLIRPAVEGSLRVLRAASAAGVQHFVQTSSTAAVMYGHQPGRSEPFTEADWTVPDAPGVTAYSKSKTLAERAARDFIAGDRSGMRYASVNPGFVLGPALDRDVGTSAEIVQLFLKGKYPACPRISFPCVDVRDVARLHRLAIEVDAPSGARYLGVAGSLWMLEMALAIRAALGPAARKVPSRPMPDWAMRLVAIFDPVARQAVPDLGRWFAFDNTRTRQALGMNFIPAGDAAAAMAESLVRLGLS